MRLRATPSAASSRSTTNRPHLGNFQAVLSGDFSVDDDTVLDAGEILERIASVQEENLKRLDDDVDILKAYLKTQSAPRTAIEALEGLTVEQHVSWKKAVARIEKLPG
jgi:uncharacterized small protein (DUF1192 family)